MGQGKQDIPEHRTRCFYEPVQASSQDLSDRFVVCIQGLSEIKHHFSRCHTIPEGVWMTERLRRGKTFVSESTSHRTNPFEPFRDKFGTVDLYNDPSTVGQ
jgi:hypothetical protein